MDAIAKGLRAYRACIDLPDDVTDDRLKPLVTRLLGYARQGNTLEVMNSAILSQIATEFPRALASDSDRKTLAQALIELSHAQNPGRRRSRAAHGLSPRRLLPPRLRRRIKKGLALAVDRFAGSAPV
jgi:hypothetical protein